MVSEQPLAFVSEILCEPRMDRDRGHTSINVPSYFDWTNYGRMNIKAFNSLPTALFDKERWRVSWDTLAMTYEKLKNFIAYFLSLNHPWMMFKIPWPL